VDVVEGDHDGPFARDRLEQPTNRPERLAGGGGRFRHTDELCNSLRH
jgi:hypothetical protein